MMGEPIKTYIYEVWTEKFGTLLYEGKSIGEARAWARRAHRVTNPEHVRRQQEYVICHDCDSQPCVCKKEVP